MKTYLIPILLACSLLHAQEMPQQVRQDLSEFQGLNSALYIHSMKEQLGSAFLPDDFIRQLETALQRKSIARPKTAAERMVAAMREAGLEARDIDSAHLLKHMRTMLDTLPGMSEKELDKHMTAMRRKVVRGTIPVLHAREAAKEHKVLELNARRSSVALLPNGVQMEVEPGSGNIRAINRIMTEENLTDPERTTTQCCVDDLPESIQRMLEHVPAGSAWIFWIPAEVTDAIAAEGRESAEEQAGREDLMDQLAGRPRGISLDDALVVMEEKNRDKEEDDDFPEPRTRLLKVTVWQDAADAPIRPYSHPTRTQGNK